MNLVNLTPHAINVYDTTNELTRSIPPSGQVARCESYAVHLRFVDGIPVVRSTFGPVTELSNPRPDTIYIVSSIVAQALVAEEHRRQDVVAPDTGPESVIRDEAGRIIGVRRFQVFG